MSTSFNPQTPTDNDSVYDAYFAFKQNLVSVHNLINVDHYNGSNPNFHGNHRLVNLPKPLDNDPQPTDDLGVIYTKKEDGKTKLKFATSAASWVIALGDQQGGDGGGEENPQPKPPAEFDGPSYTDDNNTSGSGHMRFSNGFAMVWIRGTILSADKGKDPGNKETFKYPFEFERLYFVDVNYGDMSGNFFIFQRMNAREQKPPNFSAGKTQIDIYNPNQSWNMSVQALIIGKAQK